MPTVLPLSLSTCSEEHQPLVSRILGEMGDPNQGPNASPSTSTGIDYPRNIRSEIFLTVLKAKTNQKNKQSRTEEKSTSLRSDS